MRFRKLAAVIAVGTLALSPITSCKMDSSLLQNMGGMEGLSKFNDAFGANLLANPATYKFFDRAAVDMVKRGITTEVAKISKVPMPNEGVDLRAVLKEKKLDSEGKKAFKASAEKATKDVALSPAAAKEMMSLINGVL